MNDETYEYPYGSAQTHEALADLDKRLKALEPKQVKKPDAPVSAAHPVGTSSGQGIFAQAGTNPADKPAV